MKKLRKAIIGFKIKNRVGYGYLLKQYMIMIIFAFKRIRIKDDFFNLLFFLSAPLLYLIKFEGKLKTPMGFLLVTKREVLRSFAYGFFKTYFTYMYVLQKLSIQSSSAVIVDVGANIGDFTLAMKNFAKKIIAIEPEKENFLNLCANLKINNIRNVVPIRVAAHNCEEEVFLQGQSSNMYIAQKKKGQQVKGKPLDFIIKDLEIENIDILKIDVQGHERNVIIGAERLLKGKFVKLLILEVHLKRNVSVESIKFLMKSYGYSLIYKDAYLFDQPHLYFKPKKIYEAIKV